MEEIMQLKAEVIEPEKGIQSNIAELQRMCLDMAEEMRGAKPLHTPEEYKEAKRVRADVRRAIKQVEDERKRVKVAWTAPLTTFEASVKGALSPLSEVEAQWAAAIKDYEQRGREAKYKRLEAYWEQAYPALALCTVGEPLVPFSRVVEIVGGDWCRRVSELDEGRDGMAKARMDELAESLAAGAETISKLNEPAEVVTMALSELYRTFNVVQAIDAAKREHERIEGMRELGRAQAQTSVPEVPEQAPEPPAEPPRVTAGAELPADGFEMPERGSFEPAGYVCIPIRDRAHMEAVISVMKDAGISGMYRAASRVRILEGDTND